ncbi:hypothetical protein FQN60_010072 [Etheostoma spectabile]|uniref:E2 ubiquitin-conjugating enzyme n=1 Tax=Etheostoma spectabile TaxID=54343 RepID=A0A5J5D3U9_9PERO|nr:hypothetical protein FQN60_010072 [Etheostoma spectabile]
MSTPARRRLMRDFKRLQEDPPAGVSGAPSENNIMVWNAVIFGPEGTPFEDGTFKLTIEFTEEYPNKPPTVRFVSKMFHPNVYADGSICLDILQNRWSPTYDVSSILTSIQSLLDEPNPNSPANSQAAQLYQENKREYEKRAVFLRYLVDLLAFIVGEVSGEAKIILTFKVDPRPPYPNPPALPEKVSRPLSLWEPQESKLCDGALSKPGLRDEEPCSLLVPVTWIWVKGGHFASVSPFCHHQRRPNQIQAIPVIEAKDVTRP